MAGLIPESLPPPHLHERTLTFLISQLSSTQSTSPNFIQLLRTSLDILAFRSLHAETCTLTPSDVPLRRVLELSSSPSTISTIDSGLLTAVIFAYPNHLNAIKTILERCPASTVDHLKARTLPAIITRVEAAATSPNHTPFSAFGPVRALLIALRCLGNGTSTLALGLLPSLSGLYKGLPADEEGIRVKQDILLIVQILFMGDSKLEAHLDDRTADGARKGRGKVLVDNALKKDYQLFFGGAARKGVEMDKEVREILRSVKAQTAGPDERLTNLVSLFPHIPPALLSQALAHPTYRPAALDVSAADASAPLIEAILDGGRGLPGELWELRAAIEKSANGSSAGSSRSSSVPVPVPSRARATGRKVAERSNIWDTQLDMANLKLKDNTDDPRRMEELGDPVPQHIRDAIKHLVETQQREQEEQAAAIAEAHGPRGVVGIAVKTGKKDIDPDDWFDDDEDDAKRWMKFSGEGDWSGAEDYEGDEKKKPDTSRRVIPPKEYEVDVQSKLELAYLANPELFARDSNTRRSDARRLLRERTGMDDGQLEGWKIMLERNPHKDAILGRHQFVPKQNLDYLPVPGSGSGSRAGSSNRSDSSRGRGSERSTPGSGNGGGGGGGHTQQGEGQSRGGRGGGGGGRGRGANKGSRGHSNAARTRGHDKKMSKMGAGL